MRRHHHPNRHGRGACTNLCASRCHGDSRNHHRHRRACTSPCVCRGRRPAPAGRQARRRIGTQQKPTLQVAFSWSSLLKTLMEELGVFLTPSGASLAGLVTTSETPHLVGKTPFAEDSLAAATLCWSWPSLWCDHRCFRPTFNDPARARRVRFAK